MQMRETVSHGLVRVVVMALAAVTACSKKQPVRSSVMAIAGTAPMSQRLEPSYVGAAGDLLTFYDDCHCEIAGEDSGHYHKRYVFDEEGGKICVDNLMTLLIGDDVLVEVGHGDDDFFDKLQGRGRWSALMHDAGSDHPIPRFPRKCICAAGACALNTNCGAANAAPVTSPLRRRNAAAVR